MTHATKATTYISALMCLTLAVVAVSGQQQQQQVHLLQQQQSANLIVGRRAADQSRPLNRVYRSEANNNNNQRSQQLEPYQGNPSNLLRESTIIGKFKAPAPERITMSRVAANSEFGSQAIGASFRVSDGDSQSKIINGKFNNQGQQQLANNERRLGAKLLVSDDGLDYAKLSKLSADIHGNVAEIVTAPPNLVPDAQLWDNN